MLFVPPDGSKMFPFNIFHFGRWREELEDVRAAKPEAGVQDNRPTFVNAGCFYQDIRTLSSQNISSSKRENLVIFVPKPTMTSRQSEISST